jgi:hypothetical protein
MYSLCPHLVCTRCTLILTVALHLLHTRTCYTDSPHESWTPALSRRASRTASISAPPTGCGCTRSQSCISPLDRLFSALSTCPAHALLVLVEGSGIDRPYMGILPADKDLYIHPHGHPPRSFRRSDEEEEGAGGGRPTQAPAPRSKAPHLQDIDYILFSRNKLTSRESVCCSCHAPCHV